MKEFFLGFIFIIFINILLTILIHYIIKFLLGESLLNGGIFPDSTFRPVQESTEQEKFWFRILDEIMKRLIDHSKTYSLLTSRFRRNGGVTTLLYEAMVYVFLLLVGTSLGQFIYVSPLLVYLAQKHKIEILKGVVSGVIITMFLATSCFGNILRVF